MPSRASAAARFAVTVDLPTPPFPDPMHTMFFTAASAPVGRPSRRPRRCCRPDFSCWLRTSKPTLTSRTPSSRRTAVATPFWKCERIGQPGVVSEMTTSTRPSAGCSIERTMPRSTMLWRSSGSMTTLRASRIWSGVGIDSGFWQRTKDNRRGPEGPRRLREERYCTAERVMRPGSFTPIPLSPGRGEGVCRLDDPRRNLVPDVLGGLRDARLDALGRTVEVARADVTRGALHGRLEVARVALHEALHLVAALAQAALELRARALDPALELVTRGGATTLGPLEALRELALRGRTRHVRLDRLDDVVASDQRRADRDQHGTLGLGGERLEDVLLRPRCVPHRVRRAAAGLLGALSSDTALARSGGALGGGAALRGSALALSGRAAAARGRARTGRVRTGAATSGAAGAAAGSAAAVLGSHCWRS